VFFLCLGISAIGYFSGDFLAVFVPDVVIYASLLKNPLTKLDSKQEAYLQADRVIPAKPSGKKPIHPI